MRWFRLPLGRRGERAARRFLKRKRHRILCHSYTCPMGEIDLISICEGVVVFSEVKTRSSREHGEPWEAVDRRKRRQITRAAVHFLKTHRMTEFPTRFDVVAITWPAGYFRRPTIEHFESAFEAEGHWSV